MAGDVSLEMAIRLAISLVDRDGARQSNAKLSQNLESIFRVAAQKNDILNAAKLMPPELSDPKSEYQFHILPLTYGLVRAGRYDEALARLRQLEGIPERNHRDVIELLVDIGKVAPKEFPVQDWIAEVNTNSAKLQLNRWNAFRVLFAQCAGTRGYAAAQAIADKLTGDDLGAAEIGIAEGLRGYRFEPLLRL